MKPMLIAIEATLAQHTLTGMGQYVINLIKGLSEVAGDNYKFLLLHSNKEWSGPDFGENFPFLFLIIFFDNQLQFAFD